MDSRPALQTESRAHHLEAILAEIGIAEAGASAAKLLDFYGSFAALSGATAADLTAILSADNSMARSLAGALRIVIAGVRETAVRSLLDPYSRRFLDYLRLSLGQRREEVLVGFFGNVGGDLLKEKVLAFGDGHSVVISPGAIMRAAVEIDAPRILLVHNHPSGSPMPSRADRAAMKGLDQRAAALDYVFVDHLIVGGTKVYSLRKGSLL